MDTAVTKAVENTGATYIYKKSKGTDLHPFVVISDTVSAKDVAICFFSYSDADKAVGFRRGNQVTLYGQVYRFVTLQKRNIVVMDKCEVN